MAFDGLPHLGVRCRHQRFGHGEVGQTGPVVRVPVAGHAVFRLPSVYAALGEVDSFLLLGDVLVLEGLVCSSLHSQRVPTVRIVILPVLVLFSVFLI